MRDPTSRSSDAPWSGTERPDDGAKLQLLAEEISVAKKKLEIGRVRVSTHTHQREVVVDEDLARERVEIETIPINLQIDTVPAVREEGDTTIIPVVEEQLVVERRLMLKEEVRIKRVRSAERHQEKVKLRYQEAVVTRQKGEPGKPASVRRQNPRKSDADVKQERVKDKLRRQQVEIERLGPDGRVLPSQSAKV